MHERHKNIDEQLITHIDYSLHQLEKVKTLVLEIKNASTLLDKQKAYQIDASTKKWLETSFHSFSLIMTKEAWEQWLEVSWYQRMEEEILSFLPELVFERKEEYLYGWEKNQPTNQLCIRLTDRAIYWHALEEWTLIERKQATIQTWGKLMEQKETLVLKIDQPTMYATGNEKWLLIFRSKKTRNQWKQELMEIQEKTLELSKEVDRLSVQIQVVRQSQLPSRERLKQNVLNKLSLFHFSWESRGGE